LSLDPIWREVSIFIYHWLRSASTCVLRQRFPGALNSDSTLESLGEEVGKLTMEKSSIGWQLEQLESATRAVADGWTSSSSSPDSTSDSSSDDGPESSDSGR
jgi:hypothetical protein